MIRAIATSTLVVLLCTPMFAAHPLATDDAGTVAPATNELEATYDTRHIPGTHRTHSSDITLKQGITNRMDIGINVPYQIDPPCEERFGCVSLLVKMSLIEELLTFSIANEMGEKMQ